MSEASLGFAVYLERLEKGEWQKRRFFYEQQIHAETVYENAQALINEGNPYLRNPSMKEVFER